MDYAMTVAAPGGADSFERRPIAPPAPGPGEALVRHTAIGLNFIDVYHRSGLYPWAVERDLVPGSEAAGVVEAVGPGVTGIAPGTRVAVNPSRWCGSCPRCREGRRNLCENIYFMGSASKTPHMQGGFSTRFDATPAQCVPVPDHVPLEAAALAEPLAVCLHAVNRARVSGRSVAIIGAGPIGLLTLLAARLRRGAASDGAWYGAGGGGGGGGGGGASPCRDGPRDGAREYVDGALDREGARVR